MEGIVRNTCYNEWATRRLVNSQASAALRQLRHAAATTTTTTADARKELLGPTTPTNMAGHVPKREGRSFLDGAVSIKPVTSCEASKS